MAETKKSTSKTSPFVLLILLLNTAAVGFLGYKEYIEYAERKDKPSIEELVQMTVEGRGSEEAREELVESEKDEGFLLPLEGFTVNLAQGDGPRRYLRVKTVLKFNQSSKEEEFQARKPQIRDAIISILNSKKPEDLLKREGKLYLKEEIKNAMNSFLVSGSVTDVFYVGFQIN